MRVAVINASPAVYEGHKEFMTSQEQLAWVWLAGLIDGEGSISIRSGRAGPGRGFRRHYSLRLSIWMTHRPTMEKLPSIAGGKCLPAAPRGIGKKKGYVWERTGPKAAAVLRRVYPFLVTKKEQAHLGLEFFRVQSTGHKPLSPTDMERQKEYWLAMKELNQ